MTLILLFVFFFHEDFDRKVAHRCILLGPDVGNGIIGIAEAFYLPENL